MNALPVRLTLEQAWAEWIESRTPTSREWLVVHYASLVKFVAGRVASGLPRHVEVADLVSAGVFGLMGALDRFDPGNGAKFETYAVPRIRGAILDGLRQLDWVPRTVRSRAKSIERAIETLEHELGRSPNDEEIAERLGVEVSEYEGWLADAAAGSVGPLDHLLDGSRLRSRTATPDEVVDGDEMRRLVRREVRGLPERERTVLALYYEEGLTLGEIGEVLGVTESRVSQLHTKAVMQLRTRLRRADVA